jgi:hypothetical protein
MPSARARGLAEPDAAIALNGEVVAEEHHFGG